MLIGVVERFMSITEGFVANSRLHDDREHRIELSLLDSRTIGFDRSPWWDGVNCRAEGINSSPGSSTRTSVNVIVVNEVSCVKKQDHCPYNVHFVLSEIVQILQIERHAVVVVHGRVLFFGDHVLTCAQKIVDQIENVKIDLAVENDSRRIDSDRQVNRVRNVIRDLRMRVVLALNLDVLAANEIGGVIAIAVANLTHRIATMRLERNHDGVLSLVIRHVSQQNGERKRGQRVVVELWSGDGDR